MLCIKSNTRGKKSALRKRQRRATAKTGDNALPEEMTAPQQSEVRQDTVHHKTETSREQPVTFAGKKKSVTFGDAFTEEEKRPREHGPTPTPGGVTSAAKTGSRPG